MKFLISWILNFLSSYFPKMSKPTNRFDRAIASATGLGPAFALEPGPVPVKSAGGVKTLSRITVSLPASELDVVEHLRRAASTRRIPNQSEIIRAGLLALSKLDVDAQNRLLADVIAR